MIEPGTQYLMPTPAAAFHVVAGEADTRLRRFLLAVIANAGSIRPDMAMLRCWSALDDEAQARGFVEQLVQTGWLQMSTQALELPDGQLEDWLPKLLPPLSPEGQVLLADPQGFAVYSHGFPPETVDELAALSADLANLDQRRGKVLHGLPGLSGGAWALTGPTGQSRIGFWPLYVGNDCFVLVVAGLPLFNQPELVSLVVLLHRRLRMSRPGHAELKQ